jgi:hypothetical protein
MSNNLRNTSVAALAFALAVTAFAPSSFAQRGEGGSGAARESALRECNAAAAKYTDHGWETMKIDSYRACMAAHGQQE